MFQLSAQSQVLFCLRSRLLALFSAGQYAGQPADQIAQPILYIGEFFGGEQSLVFLQPEAEKRQRAVRAGARSREHLVIEASLRQIGFRGSAARLQLDQTPFRTAW